MAKKQATKVRTKAKELPRKKKSLTPANLKKIKGGYTGADSSDRLTENVSLNYSKIEFGK
ncbi:MAG TPA: hypothetical protein VFD48_14545 [Pyrinomonadaceae bacterium]|nr:hypothetical protein [Pyrinomonadaceae bacterium]